MAIKKVTLVGANGNLGTVILDGLVAAKAFDITILQRESSKSKPAHSSSINIISISDSLPIEELTKSLKGQDAVITSFPLKDVTEHLRIASAAAQVGVQRFIPADFGSCDSSTDRAQELVALFKKKTQVRERLESLAKETPSFTWSSIVCGHFFDWGLKANFLHFNLQTRKAEILDDGNKRSSQSSLARVAEATVRILQKPEVTANKVLFIQSFCVSQMQVLASLEKVTGEKWTVQHIDSEEFIKEEKGKADAGSLEAIEELVFALGAIDGNWEDREGFAMKLLGLDNEDLDTVVKKALE